MSDISVYPSRSFSRSLAFGRRCPYRSRGRARWPGRGSRRRPARRSAGTCCCPAAGAARTDRSELAQLVDDVEERPALVLRLERGEVAHRIVREVNDELSAGRRHGPEGRKLAGRGRAPQSGARRRSPRSGSHRWRSHRVAVRWLGPTWENAVPRTATAPRLGAAAAAPGCDVICCPNRHHPADGQVMDLQVIGPGPVRRRLTPFGPVQPDATFIDALEQLRVHAHACADL
jgi:hypothetical protein